VPGVPRRIGHLVSQLAFVSCIEILRVGEHLARGGNGVCESDGNERALHQRLARRRVLKRDGYLAPVRKSIGQESDDVFPPS
jgi:hypothetical protein